jgi:hypothetical protein
MHKNQPDLLASTTMQARTWGRLTDLLNKYKWEVLPHAPHSLDTSPPKLDLFRKLKEPICGHHFPSLEKVSASVTQTIRGLNKSGTLNGIANLPKQQDAVIAKQGYYT